MAGPQRQAALFPEGAASDDIVIINGRCQVRTHDGHRVVVVGGTVLAQYAVGDLAAEALAMVSLVDQGLADQVDVARSFRCTSRTVRRHQRRYEAGERRHLVHRLKGSGTSNCEIARRGGVAPWDSPRGARV